MVTSVDEHVATATVNAKLPNLAPRIISVILLVWLVLLLGLYLQERNEDRQIKETKLLSLYHQQNQLIGQLVLELSSFDLDYDYDIPKLPFRTKVNQLLKIKDRLRHLEEQVKIDNGMTQKKMSDWADKIIANTNELVAMIGTKTLALQQVTLLTTLLEEDYDSYLEQNLNVTSTLSNKIYSDKNIERQLRWWITGFTMLIVLLVSLAIYWRGKKLVHQQFNRVRETTKQLDSILNSTVDAIITINGMGRIMAFNKAAESMFGHPAKSVIGKNIKILMPEPYSSEHDGYLAHFRNTGEKKVIGHIREVEGKRIDGSVFPLRLSVSEVQDITPPLYTGIIRDITHRKKRETKLNQTLQSLTAQQEQLKEEERIARHVFENITTSNNDTIIGVSSWCEPMGTFSGDMMLSAILPSGDIRILLCDFTGHGLPAALGAVPVSTIHSAMAKKGLPLEILMNELNDKLNDLLPTGIFCCIAGIDLNETRTQAQIWNAGLPDVLVVNDSAEISQRISSSHLPVGVTSYSKSELHCQTIDLNKGDVIYALSDGLTEAENEVGELFGQQRFEQLLLLETDDQGRLTEIRSSVSSFVGKAAATDDISLIEIKTLVTDD